MSEDIEVIRKDAKQFSYDLEAQHEYIETLERRLAQVEAQKEATVRDSREKARLLSHAKARLAEVEDERDEWKQEVEMLKWSIRRANKIKDERYRRPLHVLIWDETWAL